MKKKNHARPSLETQHPVAETSIRNKSDFFLIRFLPAFLITLLPILVTGDHWLRVWNGGLPRAWDGTGHYAVAQIYANEIFPDTFGWIDNFFAGMPFPNFYPPLFYWLIALLSKLGIFSFLTSFKIIVCLPIILMPSAIWFLAWKISEKNRVTAALASLICVWLLVDYHFASAAFPLGLDYFSTFQIGLYAQPLGFILLLTWLFVYQNEQLNRRQIGVAAIVLALVILANFFCAITACVFILAHFSNDLFELVRGKIALPEFRRKTFSRLLVPVLAVCLSAFWLVPMLDQSKYFVTRPTQVSLFPLPLVWVFYALALLGGVIWLGRQTAGKFYVTACACLVFLIFFVSPFAPDWFPFQTNRFLANFNFLLCLPAACFLNFIFEKISRTILAKTSFISLKTLKLAGLFAIIGLSFLLMKSPKYELSFYSDKEYERIKPILDYARNNAAGRYLVENPDPNYPAAQLDGRAINSYLGAQGNMTANIVFREASPMSLFFNPVVSVFSAYPENYGISSILADDLDFKEQSVEQHLAQAKFLGIRYFVVISNRVKEKLAGNGLTESKFGAWSVFEIPQSSFSGSPKPDYKPALVVSDFSLKARRSDDFSFLRLAEEQFNDAWFDVLLAHDPRNNKLDKLTGLENFGTVIVEKYDYNDENQAFEILKSYSQKNSVILFDAENDLLKRIKTSAEFGNLEIIDYPIEPESHRLESEFAGSRYNSSKIRSVWRRIKQNLEDHKTAANDSTLTLTRKTFHPSWQTSVGNYISTPFFVLGSTAETGKPIFGRKFLEIIALWISIFFLFACLLMISSAKYLNKIYSPR